MFSEVILRIFYRSHKPGDRITLDLNTAIAMVEAGEADWATVSE